MQKTFHNAILYICIDRFAYCKIGKVASSTWKGLLKKACGDYSPGSQSRQLPELRDNGDGLYKFLFVRHPFDRLRSAYRSKFLDPESPYLKRVNFNTRITNRSYVERQITAAGCRLQPTLVFPLVIQKEN